MNPNPVCIFGHQINKEQLKDLFFCCYQMKFPCYHTIDTVIFLLNVLTDFLTIIKYRKRDINKILSEYAEMIRAIQLDFIRQTTQIHLWGLGSWDVDTKTHMMAYDQQLKNFTTMHYEEAFYRRMRKYFVM
jgi:hypothetical protein